MKSALGLMVVLGLGCADGRGEPAPGECSVPLQQSDTAYRRGEFGEAEKWLRQALTCQEKRLAATDPDLAASYDRLSELKRLRREFGPAEVLLKRALAIWSLNAQQHFAALVEVHTGLALIYFQQHRYREAEKEARDALTMGKLVLDDAGLAEASALNTYGFLFGSLGDRAAAERHYRSALALQKTARRRDLLTANLLFNLATVRSQLGSPFEADELYRESISLHQELLPANHPHLRKTLEVYARILKHRGMKAAVRRQVIHGIVGHP